MPGPRNQSGSASVVRVYVCGGAVCAAVTVAAYLFGVRPAVARYDETVARQLELNAARQKAANLLGARNSTQNQLNAVNEALKSLTLRLEPASTVNQRLSKLTDLATRECQLVIDEMRPMPPADGADYQTVPILIAGSGTYPNCAKFLHRLRKDFPDTAVHSFETTNNSSSPDNPTATFQVELVWHAAKG
jgi:Tfp pilus assembly protein PilO